MSKANIVAMSYPRDITVDYSKTFEEMVAEGKYDKKDIDIDAESLPGEDDGTVTRSFRVAYFDDDVNAEAVRDALDAEGYRPATIEELLAFGAAYPDEQLRFPIVALGSVHHRWDGSPNAACLSNLTNARGKRSLEFVWIGRRLSAVYRFLAVGK